MDEAVAALNVVRGAIPILDFHQSLTVLLSVGSIAPEIGLPKLLA